MKITFLGTSHGIPEADRFCTGTALEIRGQTYLFDCGMPVVNCLQAAAIPIPTLKGVFITHMHGDHIDGVLQLCDLCNWYFKTAEPVFYAPEDTLGPAVQNWLSLLHGEDMRQYTWHTYVPGLVYADDRLRVTAIATAHCPPRPSHAFLVEAEGKRILFTGDLSYTFADFPQIAYETDFDLIICEAAHDKLTAVRGVLYPAKTKQLAINHIAPNNPPAEFTAFAGNAPYPCIYTHDGLALEL